MEKRPDSADYNGPFTPLTNPPTCPVRRVRATATTSTAKRNAGELACGLRCSRMCSQQTSQISTLEESARNICSLRFPRGGFALELQLPRQDAGCDGGHGGDGRRDHRVIRGAKQSEILLAQRQQIERDADKNQRDWKVDQRHVLRVFGEEHRLQIKRIHSGSPRITALRFWRSSSDESRSSSCTCPVL